MMRKEYKVNTHKVSTVILVLLLLSGTAFAVETTWRRAGFELWAFDINFTEHNATNLWVLDFKTNATPPVAPIGHARLYVDSSGRLKVSENGNVYSHLLNASSSEVISLQSNDTIHDSLIGNLQQNDTSHDSLINALQVNDTSDRAFVNNTFLPFSGGTITGNVILNDGVYIKANTGAYTYIGSATDPIAQTYTGTTFTDYIYGLAGVITYIDEIQSNTIKDTSGNYYIKDVSVLVSNGTFVTNNANGTIGINSSAPPADMKAVTNTYYNPSTGEVIHEVAT
jgi:hypothetical protein